MWLALEAVNIEGGHYERLDVCEPQRPLHSKGERKQEGAFNHRVWNGFPKAIKSGNGTVDKKGEVSDSFLTSCRGWEETLPV